MVLNGIYDIRIYQVRGASKPAFANIRIIFTSWYAKPGTIPRRQIVVVYLLLEITFY